MASNIDHEHLSESDGGDSEGTNADPDADKRNEKGPFYLSGCSLGHSDNPECEIFTEEEGTPELKSKSCTKNPDHLNFVSVEKFKAEEGTNNVMIARINRTVLIEAWYTSKNRPDSYYDSQTPYPCTKQRGQTVKRTGTGFIVSSYEAESPVPVTGKCPCRICKESDNPKNTYWEYHVMTATHVLFDNAEAERADCRCFYDSEEDKEGIVTLYGVKIGSGQSQKEMNRSDFCDDFVCVTHDEDSAKKINSRVGSDRVLWDKIVSKYGFIVSHPHGCSKMISTGTMMYRIIPVKPDFQVGRRENFPRKTTYHKTETLATTSKPGTGIPIPYGTTFTLPDGAEYAMRFYYDKRWFTFPRGVKFNSKHGLPIAIPDNAVFWSEKLRFDSWYRYHYIQVYNIPTCPGSSGALVSYHTDSGVHYPYTVTPHFGAILQYNRSGVANKDIRYGFRTRIIQHSKDSESAVESNV